MSFSDDLKQFSQLSSQRKLGVTSVLLIALFVGVGAPFLFRQFFFKQQTAPQGKVPQASRATATPPVPTKSLKKASFSLLPSNQTITKGTTFTVGINFDSGDYSIEAADCVLKYDPKILKVNKITPATLFGQYPQQESVEDKIYLTGISGDTKDQTGVKGKGLFASIEFKAMSTGNTTLEFVKEETIAASSGKDILGEIKGGTYTVE